MILLIDNYDSFVYNIARYVGKLGRARRVVRNDSIMVDEIRDLNPDAIILSPGPCTPREAGVCLSLIREFHREIPILGVCLGHQCIGEVFGGRTVRAEKPMHGKTSLIIHNGAGLFMGIPDPVEAARYHSLIVDLPANSELQVGARVEGERTIMALHHPAWPVYGVQFHPESVMTSYGVDMMRNFLTVADEWNERHRRASAA